MYTSLVNINRDKSPLRHSLILDSKLSVYNIDTKNAISRSDAKKLLKLPHTNTYLAELNIIGSNASVEKMIASMRKSEQTIEASHNAVAAPKKVAIESDSSDSDAPIAAKSSRHVSETSSSNDKVSIKRNKEVLHNNDSDISDDETISRKNTSISHNDSSSRDSKKQTVASRNEAPAKTERISGNDGIIKFVETHGPACVEYLRKNTDKAEMFNMSTGNPVSTIQSKTHIRSKIYTRVIIRKDTHLHSSCGLEPKDNDEIIAAIDEYIRRSDYGKTITNDGKSEHKVNNSKSTTPVLAAVPRNDVAVKNIVKDTEAIAISENIPRRERPRIADVDTIHYSKTPKTMMSRSIADSDKLMRNNKTKRDDSDSESQSASSNESDKSSSSDSKSKQQERKRTNERNSVKHNKKVSQSSDSDSDTHSNEDISQSASDTHSSNEDIGSDTLKSDSDGAASVGSTDDDDDVGFDSQADDSVDLSDE